MKDNSYVSYAKIFLNYKNQKYKECIDQSLKQM